MENRVHPELREIFSVLPEGVLDKETLPEARKMIDLMFPFEPREGVDTSERFIPGPPGAPVVRIVIYQPSVRDKILPGVLKIHGGGMTSGSPEMEAGFSQQIALEIDCVVVAVDYRLAPENPYPAAVEDCYTALKWFSENAAELQVDPTRIAVCGGSAGGGLTAAVTLMARDRKGPAIAFQAPLYPMIDYRNITPSSQEITDLRVWNGISNRVAWDMYLGSLNRETVPAYASPSMATDLSGLPRCFISVGELDPFRDEAIDYALRLSQAGVPTEFHLYPGCFHGFEAYVPDTEISKNSSILFNRALKEALHNKF